MALERETTVNRRTFFETAIGGAALLRAAQGSPADQLPRPTETRRGDMLYRSFGKTGETVSVIGVGGSHIGQTSSDDLARRRI
jgi:hypothetical protein